MRRRRWWLGGVLALVALVWLWRLPQLPAYLQPAYSVQLLDNQGRELRRMLASDGYWRLPLSLDHTDPEFIRLLLVYEDQRYYRHPGVDGLALLRALGQWIRYGRVISGASTLSMQTVRLLQPKPRTLFNKLREMILALKLEQRLSKAEILQLYLSLAPYGGNLQGLRAASLSYFGREPKHLNLSQIALLIALPQAPERRRPDRHPQLARKARDHVLKRLHQQGAISSEAMTLARSQPVPRTRRATPFLAPQVADRLHRRDQDEQQLHSTLDALLQRRLQELAARQDWLGEGESVALLLLSNADGRVLARVGSGSYLHQSQLDLTRSLRSPGSALKPFIYGLGFELGLMHPQTRVRDQHYRKGVYAPENFLGRFHGDVNLAEALRRSLNIPAVKALEKVGPQRLLKRLRNTGADLRFPKGQMPGLALALGGVGISLQDLTALYAALARQGRYIEPWEQPQKVPESRRLLSATAAWQVMQILRELPAPHNHGGQGEIAYKTGTSYGFRDAWAIGYDGRYTIGVWVGRPDGAAGQGYTGYTRAAPLLFEAFQQLPGGRAGFPGPPEGMRALTHAELPYALQWLDAQGDGSRKRNWPHILFPPASARLLLDKKHKFVVLKAQNGIPPLHWLVDGRLLPANGEGRQVQWAPDGPGQVKLTLVDAEGHTDSVSVWVETGLAP